jgi:hypothetical protein
MSYEPTLAGLAKLSNRAGYIWLSRRWPGDDRAIAQASALGIACRTPARPGKLTPQERLARAQAAAGRLGRSLAALARARPPWFHPLQVEEILEIAAELQAAAERPRPAG